MLDVSVSQNSLLSFKKNSTKPKPDYTMAHQKQVTTPGEKETTRLLKVKMADVYQSVFSELHLKESLFS